MSSVFIKNYFPSGSGVGTRAGWNCVKVVYASRSEQRRKIKLCYMHSLPLFNFFNHFKKRFMKKILSYGLSISALMLIIIACGNNDTKSTEEKKDSTQATTEKKDSVVEESDKPAVSNDVQIG